MEAPPRRDAVPKGIAPKTFVGEGGAYSAE